MKITRLLVLAAVLALPLAASDAAADGDKILSSKCKACHDITDKAKSKVGPPLWGVYGRKAGSIEGFTKYSDDIKAKGAEGMVWDDANLDAFLTKPKDFIDKTKMMFNGLSDEADRKAVIEALKGLK